MGQIKRLLDELEVHYPDDLDLTYEQWLEQKELEKLAYEEMLSDLH